MKKNIFYLLVGCVALALLLIFWYSVELHMSLVIELAFIAGVVLIIFARTKITDRIDDERDIKITEQATVRTMQVFWIIFALFSIGAVMETSSRSGVSPPPAFNAPSGYFTTSADGVYSARYPVPYDFPVCRFQNLLCKKIRRL